MNEQDDMPRADGLAPDDPPFREYFSTQPDKTVEQLMEQRRAFESRPVHVPEPSINSEQSDVVNMHDAADVISTILKIAKGGKYVNVDKLIEALR